MDLLDKYLNYLHEDNLSELYFSKVIDKAKWAKTSIGKPIGSGIGASLDFGIIAVPTVVLAWKLAKATFSSAVRKCGGIRKNTPGFRVCVSKERIKALNQRMILSKKMLSGCDKSKNPGLCKEKFQLDIEKCKNRLEIEQNKIKETIGEQAGVLKAVGGVLGGAASLGTMMVVGSIVDKALFLSLRTAQAVFSSAIRKCGVYTQGPQREVCVSKIKLNSLLKQLAIYKRIMSSCGKQKNPEGCKEKINGKLLKLNREIEIQRNNILGYTKEAETSKREEEFKEAEKKSNLH